ncbi:MAG: DUF4910 domain-containing protein [Candidatus Rokuibacteriota bacterium]
MTELYPICRSITGDGVRETLRRIRRHIPLTVHEVPTGTPVFDWTVPNEWNIRDAYVKTSAGARVIDFRRSNLHVVSYSVPVRARMRLAELRQHLHTLPEQPDRIPYRTSYYEETWGFCLTHRQLLALPDDEYDVCIDATLGPGALTYGECHLPGETSDEVLISVHACHPSLCNDNLSGVAVATVLAEHLAALPSRRYGYRLLFIPGTIGSITWLARNEERVGDIRHGLVLACLGDPGRVTYKKSRRGTADIDKAALHVLRTSGDDHEILDFTPYGYDERQYGSPGFDLPLGCFMRTPHGRFPEYHTSADDLGFVRADRLADSFGKLVAIVSVLEGDAVYVNQNPKCEPQLGKRGLYRSLAGGESSRDELAVLWVLNLADGRHSLLDIAERAGYPFPVIVAAARALLEHGLLKEVAA